MNERAERINGWFAMIGIQFSIINLTLPEFRQDLKANRTGQIFTIPI